MNIIVFSPHEDDDVFACGGTIATHAANKDNVKIVFMTDGRLGFNSRIEGKYTPDELANVRKKEALNGAREMGLDEQDVIFLGYHDQDLKNHVSDATTIANIAKIIDDNKPDLIYLAITNYGHDDHLAMYVLVFKALEKIKFSGDVRVGIPLGLAKLANPSRIETMKADFNHVDDRFPVKGIVKVNFASVIDKKIKAIKAHDSQIGMLYNLVDPSDSFEDAALEMLLEMYPEKSESFEVRNMA
ncbi:MAG: PIG-L deacetylase family protein [Promethearchaeota archaeon]